MVSGLIVENHRIVEMKPVWAYKSSQSGSSYNGTFLKWLNTIGEKQFGVGDQQKELRQELLNN